MIGIIKSAGCSNEKFFFLPGQNSQYRNTIRDSLYGVWDTGYWQSIGNMIK
jgi:hypothetical protein